MQFAVLLSDLLQYCEREKIDWTQEVMSRAWERFRSERRLRSSKAMSFPKQSEIELPLLKTLQELGGKAEPKELYPRLAETIFPQLTQRRFSCAVAKQSFDISLAQSCSVESAEAR